MECLKGYHGVFGFSRLGFFGGLIRFQDWFSQTEKGASFGASENPMPSVCKTTQAKEVAEAALKSAFDASAVRSLVEAVLRNRVREHSIHFEAGRSCVETDGKRRR